jgi:hypothetical protein
VCAPWFGSETVYEGGDILKTTIVDGFGSICAAGGGKALNYFAF